MTLSYGNFVPDEDSIKTISVSVTMPDEIVQLIIPEIAGEVAMATLGPWNEGRYFVDTVVETTLGRRAVLNRVIDVIPYPGALTTVGLKPGEQQAFRVSYADRLNDGDTVDEIEASPSSGIVFAVLKVTEGFIAVVGANNSLAEGGYDVAVTATTASGRVLEDTVRIIIGDFDV